jgi:hypothetical protein
MEMICENALKGPNNRNKQEEILICPNTGSCNRPNCGHSILHFKNEDCNFECPATQSIVKCIPESEYNNLQTVETPSVKKEGQKFDNDKPKYSLLVWDFILEIVKVMGFGAKKYSKDNWQLVSSARERYFDAAMRHLLAWKSGELKDKETSLSHLAHCACCLMFLFWFDKKD